jgi:hypothetical protein
MHSYKRKLKDTDSANWLVLNNTQQRQHDDDDDDHQKDQNKENKQTNKDSTKTTKLMSSLKLHPLPFTDRSNRRSSFGTNLNNRSEGVGGAMKGYALTKFPTSTTASDMSSVRFLSSKDEEDKNKNKEKDVYVGKEIGRGKGKGDLKKVEKQVQTSEMNKSTRGANESGVEVEVESESEVMERRIARRVEEARRVLREMAERGDYSWDVDGFLEERLRRRWDLNDTDTPVNATAGAASGGDGVKGKDKDEIVSKEQMEKKAEAEESYKKASQKVKDRLELDILQRYEKIKQEMRKGSSSSSSKSNAPPPAASPSFASPTHPNASLAVSPSHSTQYSLASSSKYSHPQSHSAQPPSPSHSHPQPHSAQPPSPSHSHTHPPTHRHRTSSSASASSIHQDQIAGIG